MTASAPSGMRDLILRLSAEPRWNAGMTELITKAIVAELPGIADDLDSLRAMRESVAANMRLMVEMVRSDIAPSQAEPPPAAAAYAREFVRRGMPIDSLLRSYLVGHAAFFRHVREELPRRIDDPATLASTLDELLSWTFGFIETLTRGIAEQYGAERERWVRSAAAFKAELVDAVLAGQKLDPEAVSTRLRYRLDRNHLAFVVWSEVEGPAGDPAACERVAAAIAAAHAAADPLLLRRGAGLVAGWLGSHDPRPEFEVAAIEVDGLGGHDRIRVAFGSAASGADGFRKSHAQAMEARRVAMMLGEGEGRAISSYHELSLPALSSRDPVRGAEFCEAELGLLLTDDERCRRLRRTLLGYLESSGSPRRAARRLDVHENTVVNHVRAAEELVGHPLDERVGELIVALRLAPLVGGIAARGGDVETASTGGPELRPGVRQSGS